MDKFKSKVDKGSQYPAWYMDQHIEELQEEIRRDKAAIENEFIAPSELPRMRQMLKKKEARLEDVESHKPQIKGADKDKLHKMLSETGDRISEMMPTRERMDKRLVDPSKEMEQMLNPCVKIDPELAEAAGIKLVNGKCTRDEAVRVWQMGQKLFGESTDSEELRRDR